MPSRCAKIHTGMQPVPPTVCQIQAWNPKQYYAEPLHTKTFRHENQVLPSGANCTSVFAQGDMRVGCICLELHWSASIIPPTCIDFHRFALICIELHWLASIRIGTQWFASIRIEFHRLSMIRISLHRLVVICYDLLVSARICTDSRRFT